MCERKTITDEDLDEVFTEGLKLVLARKKLKGIPISKYDLKTKRAYLEYADGRKVYAEKA